MNCNTLLLHTPMASKRCTKEPELTLFTGESCFYRWSRKHNEDVVQARIPPTLHGGSEQCQPSGACFAHFPNSDRNPWLRSRQDSITVPASQYCLYRCYSGMKDCVTEGRSCLHLQLHEASRIVSDTRNMPASSFPWEGISGRMADPICQSKKFSYAIFIVKTAFVCEFQHTPLRKMIFFSMFHTSCGYEILRTCT
jgi:hypothetical protein